MNCLRLLTGLPIVRPLTKMTGETWVATVSLEYVNIYRDRHGKERATYRRGGRRVALPLPVGGPAFLKAYQRLREQDDIKTRPNAVKRVRAYSFAALAAHYYSSPGFKKLRASTQRTYRSSIDQFCEAHGHRSVAGFTHEKASFIIGSMADRPAAANKLLKRLRTLIKAARRLNWIDEDPTEGIEFFPIGEIHTWTAEEHKLFLDHWAPGTKARLAYMLHFHTGQRRSDVVRMARPRRPDDLIRIEQVKTGAKLSLSIPSALWEEIERHPAQHVLMLTTEYGKPFSVDGYGNWFRERCNMAGLPTRCTSHGLRKAAASELAEAGCSANQIAAVTGHMSLKEVERYTRAADQERMAKEAARKRTEYTRLTNRAGSSD